MNPDKKINFAINEEVKEISQESHSIEDFDLDDLGVTKKE